MTANFIDLVELDKLYQEAKTAPRGRSHLCIHDSPDDHAQRIVIAMTESSYVRPHRHMSPHLEETLIMLHGTCNIVLFDDEGTVTSVVKMDGINNLIAVLKPGQWHSVVCTSEKCSFFEAKAGPYNPADKAEFLAGTPDEGSPEATQYLEKLRNSSTGQKIQ